MIKRISWIQALLGQNETKQKSSDDAGAIATDDAELNLREERTNDEINDVMLMRKPEPTIISANLDEKLEHSGEAEAKRINAKYGVLPNGQCLTFFWRWLRPENAKVQSWVFSYGE